MIKKTIITIWAILFFLSVMSLFVFSHELTHVIRFNEPQMMCVGFGESFGRVYHLNEINNFQEEVIANIFASLVCLVYMFVTFYTILKWQK